MSAAVAGGRRRVRAAALVLAALLPGAALATRAEPVPRRIASVTLAADEVLVDILEPERLVSVTAFADDPTTSNVVGRAPAAAVRFTHANLEKLLLLRPDLVVVSEFTDADFLRQLERSGLRYHRLRGLDSLDGIRAAIVELGRAVGEPERAGRLVARFDERRRELAQRLTGAARPRVLYWSNPHTAGPDTSIGALIECGGGANAAAELGVSGIAPIGAERAFLADPDVVLLGGFPRVATALREHALLSRLRAVQAGRVVVVPPQLMVTLSQHAIDACWHLAAVLHPGRFRAGS